MQYDSNLVSIIFNLHLLIIEALAFPSLHVQDPLAQLGHTLHNTLLEGSRFFFCDSVLLVFISFSSLFLPNKVQVVNTYLWIFASSYSLLPYCLCQLISIFTQFRTNFQATGVCWWMFHRGLSGEKKPRFGAFADFHSINTSATADFKPSLSYHQMQIWKRGAIAHQDPRDTNNLKNMGLAVRKWHVLSIYYLCCEYHVFDCKLMWFHL